MKIATIIILLFLAGGFNGTMDALQFHGACQYFDNPAFWCPGESWANKWTLNEAGNPVPGMERFWGSSTVFVFVTDGWHLAKFLFLLMLKAAVLLAVLWVPVNPWLKSPRPIWWGVSFVVATLAFSSGFWLTYNFLLK